MAIIKTPDQRVRVFISSTINELSVERKAARDAITNLRLTPIFFEAGARPHAPRDLYSAYLEQSHIFIGIYWNSYGWVAPGAEISGLEDEYKLCGNKKPKLIYVKSSDAREEKLKQLLMVIQDSDTACYQKFNDAEELKSLIENDLSVLMSESFENALFRDQIQAKDNILEQIQKEKGKRIELPIIKSEIIGRDSDMKNISEMIAKPSVSLVNILGAGGTGKTTLSVHVAHKLKDNFTDGVLFISLAAVTDPKLVASTIAVVLEIQDSGKTSVEQTLTDYLFDKNMLLVLDNFEQIVEASNVISDIINKCPYIKIIVTSRATLRVRGEHIYQLSPLETPGEENNISEDKFIHYPSVELFITRAKEVNQNLQLTEENKTAISAICNRLDGLPLAIELAASRTKLFQPAALVKRMDKLLDIMDKGQRDLPERQQTLRNTIEWSYNLLDEESKRVFRILGIFKRSWTLEAADAVINSGSNTVFDVEDVTENLSDVSLIKPVLVSHSDEPRFNMLQTVHEFANEMLDASDEKVQMQISYARYFLSFFSAADLDASGVNTEAWMDKMEYEHQNIRAAFYIFLENEMYEEAWKFFYLMVHYWMYRGGFSEALQWIKDAKIDDYENQEILSKISGKQKAETYAWAGLTRLLLLQIEEGYATLYASQKCAIEEKDDVNLAWGLIYDGCYGAFIGKEDCGKKIQQGAELAEKIGQPLALCFLYLWSYQYYFSIGKPEIVKLNLEKGRELARKYEFTYILGSAYLIEFSILIEQGDVDFKKAYDLSLEFYSILPEKGYKGLKSVAIGGLFDSMLHLKKYEGLEAVAMKSLNYARECGEIDPQIHGIMGMAQYYYILLKTEKAYKLYGALNAFIEMSNYPMVSNFKVQYDELTGILSEKEKPENKRWYEEGKKMRLEEAIAYAMKK